MNQYLIEFIYNNWGTLLILIGGVISFLWGVSKFFQAMSQEVRIEKLKTQLEIEKTQSLLNDNKFRKGYEDFLSLMMNTINDGKELNPTEKGIIEFMKIAILFAGPETIKTFGAYRKNAGKQGGEKQILLYMEKLLTSMRKDLGVSNEGIDTYDILQTFIVGDIKESLRNKSRENE